MLQWLVATNRDVLSRSSLEDEEGEGDDEAADRGGAWSEAAAAEFIPSSSSGGGGLSSSLTHVVVDEMHERSIDTDISSASCSAWRTGSSRSTSLA